MTKNGLAILALLASASGACAQSGDPATGADVYVADCVRCHASAARIVRKIDGDGTAEKTTWLDTFLADHHLRDPESKADLISYLTGL